MIELVEGVYRVQRTLGCNVYILRDERTVMVDAGFPVDAGRIMREFDDGELADPELILVTHYHLDHTGSLSKLKERYGCPVAMHAEDADVMEGSRDYEVFKVDRLRTLYYRLLGPLLFPWSNVDVDMRISDGEVIDALGGLEVIHVPGHTRGSILLYQRERGLLFTGDTVRNENGVLDGPPPLFSTDIEEAFFNIRSRILGLDFDILMPGHGDPVFGGGREALNSMMRNMGRAR